MRKNKGGKIRFWQANQPKNVVISQVLIAIVPLTSSTGADFLGKVFLFGTFSKAHACCLTNPVCSAGS
jgi:hypothetical protein